MEMVKIIPNFDGDTRLLPLFIKKCEYILHSFQGNQLQNEYLFHVITSRLSGEAANLVGERDHINTWDELKTLLGQHFGDPRSEECLAMELESLKLNRNESYQDLCHRIQHLRSVLFSKVSETIDDPNLRLAKQSIYNHSALNTFLYNLPAYLVRLVRLRNVTTLEDALKTVLEEQNFQSVYESKHSRWNRTNFRPNSNTQLPRNYSHVEQSSASVPNNQGNLSPNVNNNRSFNQSNNSFQFRQNNNRNNNYRNNYQQQSVTRSPVPSLPGPTQRSQHFADNAPAHTQRLTQYQSPAVASGSNTDVTMRTASSRRINYTDSEINQPCNSQQCFESNQYNNSDITGIENFHILALTRPKE